MCSLPGQVLIHSWVTLCLFFGKLHKFATRGTWIVAIDVTTSMGRLAIARQAQLQPAARHQVRLTRTDFAETDGLWGRDWSRLKIHDINYAL